MRRIQGWESKYALVHRSHTVGEEGLELPGASWEAVAESVPVRVHVDEAREDVAYKHRGSARL